MKAEKFVSATVHLAICFVLACWGTRVAAQSLMINGSSGPSTAVCPNGDLSFSGLHSTAYHGTWTYTWKLFRNGAEIQQKQQSLTCDPQFPCQLPAFNHKVQASGMAGSYKLRLRVTRFGLKTFEGESKSIGVALAADPVPILKINGQSSTAVDVCSVGPIRVDGSSSTCALQYFLSVQLSDANWSRFGPEAMRWLNARDFLKYGGIGNFDAKRFAEDQWFKFVGGQYYRIKLATGAPWREVTKLVRIVPSTSAFTLNGSSDKLIPVAAAGPIQLNGSPSICPSGFFVSVELTDANGGRFGHEAMRWLTAKDFATYGPIHDFNVKKFAEDQWFKFVPGQYYRVKLAVGNPWSAETKVIRITG